MREPEHTAADVWWSQEGDAWVGTLDGREGWEVELLLRATDWHIEVSHLARGAFEREHIQAADAEEAKATAADRLRAFWSRCKAPAAD